MAANQGLATLGWMQEPASPVRERRRAAVLAAARAQARRAEAAQDQLLQGLQGLVLQLQAIADALPAHHPARAALERVMGRADALLAQAGQARLEPSPAARVRRPCGLRTLWRWLRSSA